MAIVGVRIRKLVFRKCNQKCAYCGNQIFLKGKEIFNVDHLHPTYWNWTDEQLVEKGLVRGTDDHSNLMPACRSCNRWKSEYDIDVFRNKIKEIAAKTKLTPNMEKLIADYKITAETPWDSRFYFERMLGFKAEPLKVVSTFTQ